MCDIFLMTNNRSRPKEIALRTVRQTGETNTRDANHRTMETTRGNPEEHDENNRNNGS